MKFITQCMSSYPQRLLQVIIFIWKMKLETGNTVIMFSCFFTSLFIGNRLNLSLHKNCHTKILYKIFAKRHLQKVNITWKLLKYSKKICFLEKHHNCKIFGIITILWYFVKLANNYLLWIFPVLLTTFQKLVGKNFQIG